MPDFVEALEAEIADLERRLAGHPIYRKLHDARRLLALYRSPENTVRTQTRDETEDLRPDRRPPSSGAAAEVYSAAQDYLKGRTEPTPINELMDMFAERGINPGGSVPRNTVSSLLSRYKSVFVAHGRRGWTLADATSATGKAGDEYPAKEASPASVQPLDTPEDRERSVAYDNTLDDLIG